MSGRSLFRDLAGARLTEVMLGGLLVSESPRHPVQSCPTVARRHNWRRPHQPRPCWLSLALDTALDHVHHAPRLPTPLPVLASPSAGHYHVISTPDDQHDPDATSPGAHPKQYAQPAVHPGSSTPHLLLVDYRSTIAPTPHARASRAPRYTHTSNTPRTPGTRRPAVDPKLCVTAPGPARVHPSTPVPPRSHISTALHLSRSSAISSTGYRRPSLVAIPISGTPGAASA
ncbi:hypothetical protein B0H13DRAFT_2324491 [Mycena leptocephala]|nr:hypothetical protein B0H13DRAFT_2324491 [Mycena leptocephala]